MNETQSAEHYKQQEPSAFAELRKKYQTYLLGAQPLNRENPGVRGYIERLDRESQTYYQALCDNWKADRPGLFEDLVICPEEEYLEKFDLYPYFGYTEKLASSAWRLRDIALAYKTEGCTLFGKSEVLELVLRSVQRLTDVYVTGRYDAMSGGNWYPWVVTIPDALMNLCIVLYDEMPAYQLMHCTKVCRHYVPDCMDRGPHCRGPVMTGGNLLLKANSTLQVGILGREPELLENVRQGVKKVLVYNRTEQFYEGFADGFFRDGSYIQHQGLAYIGGYGTDLFRNLAVFLRVLQGSSWDVRYEDHRERIAFDTVFQGVEPFAYKTQMMDMVSGRMVTRPTQSDHIRLPDVINAILPLRGTFPSKEENQRFDRMMRYYLGLQPEFYYSHMSNITAILTAADILADDSIQPRENYHLSKVFTMDKAVHITNRFGFTVAMHSARTFGHELINDEGKRTWNVSDGMTYLYDEDEDQYSNGYWAAVDPERLPGITAEQDDLGDGNGDRSPNIYIWTGGTAFEQEGIAAAGSQLRTLARADRYEGGGDPPSRRRVRTGTDVKKSWFMFGDRIAALGSGITSATGNRVETIAGNRKIALDGHNRLAADGSELNLPLETAHSGEPSPNRGTPIRARTITLEGEAGSRIGWYFPGEQIPEIRVLKEKRTGEWKHQGVYDGLATATFAEILFDHGENPKNAKYAYVMIPGADNAAMAAYAADPTLEILQNDPAAAAVRDRLSDTIAVNFWEPGTAAGITANAGASVLLRQENDTVKLSVSDPTQKADCIRLTLPFAVRAVESRDGRAQLLPDGCIEVDTRDTEGTAILFDVQKA